MCTNDFSRKILQVNRLASYTSVIAVDEQLKMEE